MTLGEKIVSARKQADLNQTDFAKALKYSRRSVVLWESNKARPKDEALAKISEVTRKPLSYFGVSSVGDDIAEEVDDEGSVGLMVIGRAAGGIWKEGTVTFKSYRMPVAPHPGYPLKAQRLWEVEGTSINRQAEDGEYLHGINVMESGVQPVDGDLVIVRRMEHGMAEYTAKLLTVRDGIYRLKPDSNDPQWQEEFVVHGDDATEIEILDIIIGKYEPLGRARRV